MMKIFVRFFLVAIILFCTQSVFATHNRAGEITYQWIGNSPTSLRYKVTITTFTKTSSSAADRETLDSVYWGDGSPFDVFTRTFKSVLLNDIQKNVYEKEHTYLGPGVYKIHFTDPNRNIDVVNIPNSVYVPFYLESELIISSFLGQNSSPVLTYEPIDRGCVGRVFLHNPGAHDPDPNDSLSYELIECGGFNGNPIPGYSYPIASNFFRMDSITGDLTWDSPVATGEYNVAFNIIQWRFGNYIGLVRRDMQIVINNCTNQPPEIDNLSELCVLAGDSISFDVTAIDPNMDIVILSASGGVMDGAIVPNPALFTPLSINNDTVTSHFFWQTNCDHLRPQSYFVLFSAKDFPTNGDQPLVNLKGTSIKVIAPGPSTLNAVANGSSIDLSWSSPFCPGVAHYNIYRRNGMYMDTIDCPCDNGVPAISGFTLIGSTLDGTDTTYNDNNNGQGLAIGIQFCYLVTAVYPNGSESCVSPQDCESLRKDAPVITHADVRTTDNVNGSVFVGWSKPTELDTVTYLPPYQYRVYRSSGFFGSSFNPVPIAIFNDLNDTSYVDTLIDTKTQPWSYKIELYYTDTTLKLKGQTAVASTIFLKISPTDNALILSWEEHVPWVNQRYDIFKQNASLVFDSIASVSVNTFTDTGLVNGNQYCYYIRGIGTYFFNGFVDPLINRSQQECGIPFDNVPPCAPLLEVNSDCKNSLNQLVWNNPNNICSDDVLGYRIYFGNTASGNFELIDTLTSPFDTTYIHDNLLRISGCYKVTAVDSVGNETLASAPVCVDTCRQYVLPSAFSPNGDFKNDLFHPCDSTTAQELQDKNCPPYKNVKSIDLKIYSRWGNLVFETKDKNVNWDGKFKDTKNECSAGVYFYTCKVYFFSVSGEQVQELHGTVQLIRD